MPHSPTTARDVAVAMYDALLRSDRDALQTLADPRIEIHVTKELPYGGDYFGLPGFFDLFKNTFELIESKIEITQFFDAGSQVVAVGRTRGTGRDTGQSFDAAIVHVLTVRDGRLVGFDAFVEDAPITSAIHGVRPS
ncbi:hypothetical protein GCM10011579_020850 [Streptomyces albiflavescens]|uniref:SnoaL-like domain-containing protein n=1 Tax=Streptomyces albiflavescens TaxID=1623582 RepID=A0A918D1Q3_9ACTN|nr:nuclear transport factor 2 family protein [Streptomyces albiflavescens]GGN58017.1 hypothetical protein GCM10011579_020850 [Streptomyces albiflavescens]